MKTAMTIGMSVPRRYVYGDGDGLLRGQPAQGEALVVVGELGRAVSNVRPVEVTRVTWTVWLASGPDEGSETVTRPPVRPEPPRPRSARTGS